MTPPLYISFSFCSLSIVLHIMAYNVESGGRASSTGASDAGWVTVNKNTLCQFLQEFGFCSKAFAIDDVIAQIGNFRPLNMTGNVWKFNVRSENTTWELCASALRQTVCGEAGQASCDKPANATAARKASCDKLWSSCGFVVDNAPRTNFSQYCAEVLWRKFTNMTCKAVDGGDFNGVCPQPIMKVPVFYTHVYQMNLRRLKVQFEMITFLQRYDVMSSSCFASVKELLCAPIYCSDNDTNTVMIKKKWVCSRTFSCIVEGMEKSPKLKNVLDEVKRLVEDRCNLFVGGIEIDYGDIRADPEVVAVENVKSVMEMKSGIKTVSVQVPLILVALCLKFLW